MKSGIIKGIITYAPASRKELISYAIENKKILIAVNSEKIMRASLESRKIINRNLGYPDGIGAVWALRRKGFTQTTKIPGCELWLDIVSKYYQTKSFYLIGGTQEVIDKTANRLKLEYNGIKICNYRNGYFKSDEEIKILTQDIIKLKPDIIFVAMGSPKQELLMEHLYKHHKSVYQGLGGSFDVYIGNIQRAPKAWVSMNLEWAYRLYKEPSRIKRQLVYIPFFLRLLFNKL